MHRIQGAEEEAWRWERCCRASSVLSGSLPAHRPLGAQSREAGEADTGSRWSGSRQDAESSFRRGSSGPTLMPIVPGGSPHPPGQPQGPAGLVSLHPHLLTCKLDP